MSFLGRSRAGEGGRSDPEFDADGSLGIQLVKATADQANSFEARGAISTAAFVPWFAH